MVIYIYIAQYYGFHCMNAIVVIYCKIFVFIFLKLWLYFSNDNHDSILVLVKKLLFMKTLHIYSTYFGYSIFSHMLWLGLHWVLSLNLLKVFRCCSQLYSIAVQHDRWIDGWMDGRTDGWMDGWMDGRTDGRTDDRWMNGWMNGRTDGRTDDRWRDGWMDGWMDGWLDGRTDGRIEQIQHFWTE